ncbi:MAG: hypothetical protein IIC89_05930 [Chloroflexi bacterium]|nr:hypothetical protein [Chloroflexota bacterium]
MNAPALPDRPVGRRLAYYLECIASGGEGLTEADRDRFQESPNRSFDPISPETWQRLKKQLGDFQLAALEDEAECKLVAILDGGGKRWEMSFEVAEEPPHRIGRVMIQRALDPDVTVRKATAADAPALAEIERRCPIQLGDTAITYDRGDDYFAFARLMEDVTVGLAFDAGVPAAINCCAVHSVRIGGVEQRVKTAIHTRVLPAHQRKGLWGAVNRVLNESYPDGSYACSRAYVSIDNAAMQRGFKDTPGKWQVRALRALLDCAALAGPPAGRPATPADAARIVELLNACHDAEEHFLPYTVASLTARLERAPRQYSWERLRLTDDAVVGVWPAGENVRVIIERDGERLTLKITPGSRE